MMPPYKLQEAEYDSLIMFIKSVRNLLPFNNMKSFFLFLLGFYSIANASTSSYQIENIAFPDDMPPEIGGLAFDKNGKPLRLSQTRNVLVTKPGKDPAPLNGKFSYWLHNPMGMELIGPGHIVVTQMAEFKIIDTDQDGVPIVIITSPVILVLVVYHETNAICTDGEEVLHRLRYGIAQWPHFLYSPGRILQGGPARQKFFIQ